MARLERKNGVESVQKLRIIFRDPYATESDSSNDEEDEAFGVKNKEVPVKKYVHEILVKHERKGRQIDGESGNLRLRSSSGKGEALSNIKGVRRRKSGRFGAEIRYPLKRTRIWLGTFDTAEEAAKAYKEKENEFQKMRAVKGSLSIGTPDGSFSQPQAYGVKKEVPVKKYVHEILVKHKRKGKQIDGKTGDFRLRSSSEKDEALSNIKGVRRRKSGRFGAEILDPFKRTRIWLGTFDTAEEAAKAYEEKENEFQEMHAVKGSLSTGTPDGSFSQPQAYGIKKKKVPVKKYVLVKYERKGRQIDGKSGNLRLRSSSGKREALSNIKGVYRRKTGRFGAEIRDPFKRTRIWLGTFDTAEEAANAYKEKENEFQKMCAVKGSLSIGTPDGSFSQSSSLGLLYSALMQVEKESESVGEPKEVIKEMEFIGDENCIVPSSELRSVNDDFSLCFKESNECLSGLDSQKTDSFEEMDIVGDSGFGWIDQKYAWLDETLKIEPGE